MPEQVEFTVYGCRAKHLWEGGRGSISFRWRVNQSWLCQGNWPQLLRKQSPCKASKSKLKLYAKIISFQDFDRWKYFFGVKFGCKEEKKSRVESYFSVCSKGFVKSCLPFQFYIPYFLDLTPASYKHQVKTSSLKINARGIWSWPQHLFETPAFDPGKALYL